MNTQFYTENSYNQAIHKFKIVLSDYKREIYEQVNGAPKYSNILDKPIFIEQNGVKFDL